MKDEAARCDEAFAQYLASFGRYKFEQETRQIMWNAFRAAWVAALFSSVSLPLEK